MSIIPPLISPNAVLSNSIPIAVHEGRRNIIVTLVNPDKTCLLLVLADIP